MRRPWLAVVATAFLPVIAAVALLVVPACSSLQRGLSGQPPTSAKPANPKEAVVAALNKSAAADTLTAHQVMQPTPDTSTPLNAWATAVVSRAADAVYFSGDYSAIFKSLFIGIEPSGANQEIILMRNATFWRVEGPAADRLRGQFPTITDRSWIRTPRDPSDVSDFIANIASFTQDPREFLGFEAQAVDSVLDLGSEPVNGAPMHHYAVKLDDQKWSAAITARYPEPDEGSEYSIAAVMPTEFNVWVTDSGYVGRTSGVLERELLTNDFTGYGQPVSIPIPKPEEVVNTPH
ncbi:MAG TPA: hypothetical protein VN306_09915 [Mycobacterium sp.]|nr:hypothetical protein [Mycobacterium sp.]